MIWKIAALLILILFYTVYIGKMAVQRRKGIQTDQMARGTKSKKLFITELLMKTATYSAVAAEAVSVFLGASLLPSGFRVAGILLGLCGDIVFFTAVWTMRDSWRAGIAANDQTEMVTSGIFRYSRNPAFLGFDLVYIGVLLTFFNWVLFAFSIFAIVMLHLQILQEEAFLPRAFGEQYLDYKKQVRRYLGRF